jgi:hypothetical protein
MLHCKRLFRGQVIAASWQPWIGHNAHAVESAPVKVTVLGCSEQHTHGMDRIAKKGKRDRHIKAYQCSS